MFSAPCYSLLVLDLMIFRGWRPEFTPAAWAVVLAHCVTSKERWKTMQACWMKGHRRAAASMGGGMGRMGSRWPWLRPISTTEGGLKMATGPRYINSIQGDALSSRQRDTILTASTSPPTPNHTILEMLNQSSGYLQYYIKVKGRAYLTRPKNGIWMRKYIPQNETE